MSGWKHKISLDEMRQMDIFQSIEQPKVVYHMTDRKNLDKILRDGYIDTATDFICFFFPDLKSIPIYIRISRADIGRKYYGYDGLIHTAPPLIHEETVVLKLTPRYPEPMRWFKEVISGEDDSVPEKDKEKARAVIQQFNDCRVCHYGNLKFKRDVEVIELTDIDKMTFEDTGL